MTENTKTTKYSPFDRTAQRDRKRQAILEISARLFNTKGSRGTTLIDIASRLNLTKTSLYYYVKTKEELIYLCYLDTLRMMGTLLDRAEEQASEPLETLEAFVDIYFEYWSLAEQNKAPATAVLAEIYTLKNEHKKDVLSAYSAFLRRISGIIERGRDQKTMKVRSVMALTHAFTSTMQWSVVWLPNLGADKTDQAASAFKMILRDGLSSWASAVPQTALPMPQANSTGGFNKDINSQIKQEAFIKTASGLFNRKGYKGTSLDEIAEELGVTKGAFYYHIKNKEDLLLMCFDRTIDTMTETAQLADQFGRDGLAKLFLGAARLFAIQNSEAGPLIRTDHLIALDRETRDPILEKIRRVSDRFGAFIREGLNDHTIRPINAVIAQEIVLGTIMGADELSRWQDIEDLNSSAHDYLDFIVTGLDIEKDK